MGQFERVKMNVELGKYMLISDRMHFYLAAGNDHQTKDKALQEGCKKSHLF